MSETKTTHEVLVEARNLYEERVRNPEGEGPCAASAIWKATGIPGDLACVPALRAFRIAAGLEQRIRNVLMGLRMVSEGRHG